MKTWLKKQFKFNPLNLKAIGIGFLWGIGVTVILAILGVQNPAIGIFVWILASYRYQKKFKAKK